MQNCSTDRCTKFRDDRPIRSRVILGKPEGGGCINPPPPVPARVRSPKLQIQPSFVSNYYECVVKMFGVLIHRTFYFQCFKRARQSTRIVSLVSWVAILWKVASSRGAICYRTFSSGRLSSGQIWQTGGPPEWPDLAAPSGADRGYRRRVLNPLTTARLCRQPSRCRRRRHRRHLRRRRRQQVSCGGRCFWSVTFARFAVEVT